MPVIINDVASVVDAIVTSLNGVKISQYQLLVRSCDGNDTLPLLAYENFHSNTILHPVGAFIRVRGVVLPASANPLPVGGTMVDANMGSIERLYHMSGPTDVVFQIVGTVHGRYNRLDPCLVLEVDKSHPGGWFVGLKISQAFEDGWRMMERGAVVLGTGRFSSITKMSDGITDLILFEPTMIQDVSANQVSAPFGSRSVLSLPPPPVVSPTRSISRAPLRIHGIARALRDVFASRGIMTPTPPVSPSTPSSSSASSSTVVSPRTPTPVLASLGDGAKRKQPFDHEVIIITSDEDEDVPPPRTRRRVSKL